MSEVRQLALVIPWYGPETAGGAEVHARFLAENLHQLGVSIVVLTTTAKEVFSPELNRYYPAGWQDVDGIPVLRFPAHETDDSVPRFPPMRLLPELPSLPEEERHMIDWFRVDDSLYEYIAEHRQDTLFLLMPYIWGTTFWGCLIAQDRSILIPCLHDEPHASYSIYRYMFQRAGGFLFNTQPEMELAVRLYGIRPERARVVGEGVVIPPPGNPSRFCQRFGIEEPFLFYVGRRDYGKRVDMLIEYFCAYKERNPSPLKLVLAGKYPISVPVGFWDQVIDLGFISETDKQDGYAAATIVCQPSTVESFSLVIMESWLQKTAVLVNAECAVTVHHCRLSNGGLYFGGFLEFEACLDYLLEHPRLREHMGALGNAYVRSSYTWPLVVRRIAAALEDLGIPVPYRGEPSPTETGG